MFYYKTSFSKKDVFLEKNPFMGGHDRFEWRGTSGDQNQQNLFCRHRRFEYFSFDNFFEKTNIFQNNDEKLFLWGMTIFEGTGRRKTKMNITFFWGEMVYQIQFLTFFLKNPIPPDFNPKNWFWGHIFSRIYGSIGLIVSKNIGFPHEWIRTVWISWKLVQNCDLYRNF